MGQIRLIIAEDHVTIREGLKMILNVQEDFLVVGEASDGYEAFQLAQKLEPDIVLMDISMPRLNGLKATEKIKQSCPNTRIIALTRHKDDGYLQQLLRAGASGYLLKQSDAGELVHAIRAVVAGGKYLDPKIAERVMGQYLGGTSSTMSDVAHRNLTDRETEVLRLIAWGHSNKEIASNLDLSVKTVEVHKANAMKKLGMKGRTDIVRFALLQGWLEET